MQIQTPWRLCLSWVIGVALLVPARVSALPSAGQSGTTLTANVTANAHRTITFNWGITKTADKTTLDLFRGDSSTVQYTVTLTKDAGTVHAWIDGEVCIYNGGAVATENLQSTINVSKPPSTDIITSSSLDVSSQPVLGPGESHCYPYSIDLPTNAAGNYKVTADITITNHSGHLGQPFGPNPSADTTMPSTGTVVHDSVTVSDTMGGSLGTFSASGTKSYTHTFSCDDNKGSNDNTASITYDDNTSGPTASAAVTVNCYALDVSKTVSTSFDRTYTWAIKKSANESSLALVTGQLASVLYTIDVTTTTADSNWAATGKITVHNQAPIDATINSVADAVDGIPATSVDCHVSFPWTLPGNTDLVCDYKVDLQSASGGTNTATVVLQNHADGTASGTTTFTGTAVVDFTNANIKAIDATATLSDTYPGSGLPSTPVAATDTPKTYTYTRVVGPYDTAGSYTVDNEACVKGTDTGKGGCSSVSIPVTVTTPPPTGKLCPLGTGFGYVSDTASPRLNTLSPKTCNRWGWYIPTKISQLPISGKLYVGAGNNDLSHGEIAGSFSIVVGTGGVDVTYNLDTGYDLAEVHVYAKCDTKPSSCAPGSYNGPTSVPDLSGNSDTSITVSFPGLQQCTGTVYYIVEANVNKFYKGVDTCPAPLAGGN